MPIIFGDGGSNPLGNKIEPSELDFSSIPANQTITSDGASGVKGVRLIPTNAVAGQVVIVATGGGINPSGAKFEASSIFETQDEVDISKEVRVKKLKTKNKSITIGPNMDVSNSGDDLTFLNIALGQEASLAYSRFNNSVGAQSESFLESRRLWERVHRAVQTDSSEASGDYTSYGANNTAGKYQGVITTSHLAFNPLASVYYIRGASDSVGCRLKIRQGSSPTGPLLYQSEDDFDFEANLGFRSRIYQEALTGTVSVTSASANVVGVGTSFTTQFVEGDTFQLPSQSDVEYVVASITDDTNLTLENAFARPLPTITASTQSFVRGSVRAPLAGGFYFEANKTYHVTIENKANNISVLGKRDALGQTGEFIFYFERVWQDIEILEIPNNGHLHVEMSPQIVGGTGAITIGTNTLVGTDTSFVTQFEVGDPFDLDGQAFTVQSIQDDTHLTTNENAVRTVGPLSQSQGIYRSGELMGFADYAGQQFLVADQHRNIRIPRNLTVEGNLKVDGTTTTVNSETLNVAANNLVINNGYTVASPQNGGLVVVSVPTATSTTVSNGSFVAGVAATSNPSVTTVGSGTFTASDIVMVSASTKNTGIYEVLSHVGTALTIRGIGVTATVESFTLNQFEAHTGNATITKVGVSVLRSDSTGKWERAFGNTTPLSFTKIATTNGNLTEGSILFAGSSGNINQDNTNLFWKDDTDRLGIKTTLPRAAFHAVGGAVIGTRNTDNETAASVNTSIANLAAPTNMGPTTGTTEAAVRLFRDGTSGTKYNSSVDLEVGSYASTGIASQSELKIRLGNGNTHTPDTTVARFMGNGVVSASDRLGVGTTTVNATNGIQLANATGNRRTILWETANNDHQYYGLGINANVLRYQTDSTGSDHVFYAGTSSSTSQELGRFKGDKTFEAQGSAKLKGGALVTGVVGTDTNDGADNQRLRVTAGSLDTFDNSRGASVDLHGNEHFNAGALDLVAGGTSGEVTTWTNGIQRTAVSASGDLVLENKIQIKGGVPALNKVLTSNATGVATWEVPSAANISSATTGDVAATTVQGAIAELASEKAIVGSTAASDLLLTATVGTATTAARSDHVHKQPTAGANTQVQFNNSGIFGADSNFIWNNTDKRLGLGGATPRTLLHVKGNSLFGARDTGTETIQSLSANTSHFVTPTNMGPATGTTETAMRLFRDGTTGTKFNSSADFQIGSYSTSGINAQSELKIRLGNGAGHTPDTDVAQFRANGATNLNGTLTVGGLVGVDTVDGLDNERLRVTAGSVDTQDNSRGASVDLHGNEHINAGRLDLVGGGTGAVTTWTGGQERITTLGSNGFTGYGNTNPLARVTIGSGMGVAPSNTQLLIEDTSAPGITLSGNYGQIRFGRSNNNGAGFMAYNHGDNSMSFGVNGSTPFTINSSLTASFSNNVNVGLATGSSASVQVATQGSLQTDVDKSYVTTQHSGGIDTGSTFMATKTRGTFAAPTAVLNDDTLGRFASRGHTGSGFVASGVLHFQASQNWTGSVQGTKASIRTIANGQTNLSDSLTINGSKNVGIGGVASANGRMQFPNETVNRSIVLYESANNDHQYFGFGVNAGTLRYQVDGTSNAHKFYAGSSVSTSDLLFTVQGDKKAVVEGALQVKGGTPAAGRRLIGSDALGNATWGVAETSTVSGGNGIALSATATSIVQITLPRAGKYKIEGQMRCSQDTKDSWGATSLFQVGTGVIADSENLLWCYSAGVQNTNRVEGVVTVTGSTTIQLRYTIGGGGSGSALSDANGRCKISYQEI